MRKKTRKWWCGSCTLGDEKQEADVKAVFSVWINVAKLNQHSRNFSARGTWDRRQQDARFCEIVEIMVVEIHRRRQQQFWGVPVEIKALT